MRSTTSLTRAISSPSSSKRKENGRRTYREKHGYDWTNDSRVVHLDNVDWWDREKVGWFETRGRQGQATRTPKKRWCRREVSRSDVKKSFDFRGTIFDEDEERPFVNDERVFDYMIKRKGNPVSKLGRALRYVHGEEAFEAYFGKHVVQHVYLARCLRLWTINFYIRHGRWPKHHDATDNIRELELQYINIGFQIRELDE